MKYAIDFDRTAYDMKTMYEQLETATGEEKGGAIAGTTESLDLAEVHPEDLLFADFIDFVVQKNEQGDTVEILSSCDGKTKQDWDPVYQREKISRSGLEQYVQTDHIHVVEKDKEAVLRDMMMSGEPVVFIDDRRQYIDMAIRLRDEGLPIVPVLMDRNDEFRAPGSFEGFFSMKESIEFPHVQSFREVDRVVQKELEKMNHV